MFHILRRLRNRIRYRRFDADIAEEMAFHRSMKADELMERARLKPSPTTVENAIVRRVMGNELRMRESARAVWVPPRVDAIGQDVRDAWRLIVRRPLVSVAAVAALVVGIGSSTIAFSLLNALVLRPLPVEQPGELVYLADPSFSYPIVRELHARSASFAGAFAWNLEQYDVAWGAEPEPALVLLASSGFYPTLRVRPALGRLLTSADEGTSAANAATVGVISHGAWLRRFGADPEAIGKVVTVQGMPITIVGVTAPGFFGVAPGRAPAITVPVALAQRLRPSDGDVLAQRGRAWLHFMARLRDGVSLQHSNAELQVLWPQVLQATVDPTASPAVRERFLARRSALVGGATGFSSVRNQFRQPLVILAGLAVLLMLVGCATVANLLLGGVWGRSRELAVRIALGCGRARLARQLFIEGLVLAAIAGVATIVLSKWSADALVTFLATTQDPVVLDLAIDWRVAGFLAGAAGLSALIFSAAPILMAARVDPGPALKAGSRQVAAQGHLAGRALVAGQIAVSVTLLVGAALFLRSLGHLLSIDPGFDSARVLVARLEPAASGLTLPAADESRGTTIGTFQRALLDAIGGTREVEAVALSMYPPVSDRAGGSWTQSVGIDGAAPVEENARTFFNAVSPGYFGTIGTKLLSGREFAWSDAGGSERVVIVNESIVRRLFSGQSPIGRRITIGLDRSRRDLMIVGVVADSKYQRLQEDTRDIAYLPCAQASECLTRSPLYASIRVARMSDEVSRAIRTAIGSVDARLRPRIEPLEDRIRESLVTERLLAMLGAALAASALFLATAGLFGLMAHMVARRTREIGVRLALGAPPLGVLRSVLLETLGLATLGLAAGLLMAAAGERWISGVLHGVTPGDPLAYGAVTLVTIVIAAAAGFVPAQRAASVDPIEAIRAE